MTILPQVVNLLTIIWSAFSPPFDPARGGFPSFELRAARVTRNELWVLLDTSRTYSLGPMSHSSMTADAKGWLIIADLSKPGPIAAQSRVFGPLFDVPHPRSSLSFTAGENFTDDDFEVATITPWLSLDPDGTLIRITGRGKDEVPHESHLVISRNGGRENAHWVDDGKFVPIPDRLGWPKEDQVTTPSGRHHLQRIAGAAVTLHEEWPIARRVEDRWLERAFAACRDIPHFSNVELFLTDDLRYFVCNPASVWNTGQGVYYRNFEFDGKTYDRKKYLLIWTRPDARPAIVEKGEGDGIGLARGPSAAYSINGKLYFSRVDSKARTVRLAPIGEGPAFTMREPLEEMWNFSIQHLPKEGQLITFGSNKFNGPRQMPNEAVIVETWDYRKNTVQRVEVRTADLFDRQGAWYVPKTSIQIGGS